ncbi:MAG TPA: M48 family metallopeptidase [Fimbriimonadaceae bacterium]|nr:M48 family metallopeptidase [Fimbriimonadaceae bacterium]
MPDRKKLVGLTADAFVSDADRWALDKLKKVPLLAQVVSKFYEIGIDRWLYCYNMGTSIRCGPNQYKTLHNIMRECAATLDMPEPELYVTNNPFANAYAGGVERPYITLLSGIIQTMSDEQLYHLIGHELGHIKANHMLYFSVGSLLFPLLDMLGRRTMGTSDVAMYALALAFYEWSRQAEFSADRAGLLCTQNLETSLGAEIALAAGPSRLKDEMSLEAFMEQARTYQDASKLDQLGKAVFFALWGKSWTHPMPVHRAQALERWVHTGEYDRVIRGEYVKAAS